VVHTNLVYDQIRSSNNQLQRTGFTGPCLSERCSPAAELERSKDESTLMGGSKASLYSRSQETKVDEKYKPAKQGGSSDELLASVI
jgi:hypothetical protein